MNTSNERKTSSFLWPQRAESKTRLPVPASVRVSPISLLTCRQGACDEARARVETAAGGH